MPSVERTALILLAAGRGERLGGGKLHQPLLGRPLGLHVAGALAPLPFRQRIAVVGDAPLDYAAHGFRVVRNDDPAAGMGRSVQLGVEAAEGADAVLIALADMPRVTAAHVLRLFAAAAGEMAVVASGDGRAAKPPALFGRGRFDVLRQATGDAGARNLIRTGRLVAAPADELIDVDTPEQLQGLRELVGPLG